MVRTDIMSYVLLDDSNNAIKSGIPFYISSNVIYLINDILPQFLSTRYILYNNNPQN